MVKSNNQNDPQALGHNRRDAKDRDEMSGSQAALDYAIDRKGSDSDEGKDFGIAGVREHMEVHGACDSTIGRVASMNDEFIKVACNANSRDQLLVIPIRWIARVDSFVHLDRTRDEVMLGESIH